jgi:hypothetical protein
MKDETTQNKITTAITNSAKIDTCVERANESLARLDGRVLNGHGVYADIRALKTALQGAQSHIKAALHLVEQTDWPTNAEYDAE